MEFLGTLVNLVVVLGGLMIAPDWLVGLRSDVAVTRGELNAAAKELLETRVEVNEFNLEATNHATENQETLADLLEEMRELREENRTIARQNIAMGDMVKLLLEGRLKDLAAARARGENPEGA